jgi:GNAT superfamily N-acetyltransferase
VCAPSPVYPAVVWSATPTRRKASERIVCAGGFFEGWPDPPDPDEHLRLLENGDAGVHALEEPGDVVGFITATADDMLYAYIPLLEVLPAYRGGGIYRQLLRRVLSGFRDLTWCGPPLRPRAAAVLRLARDAADGRKGIAQARESGGQETARHDILSL